jgi:hypothetical protein
VLCIIIKLIPIEGATTLMYNKHDHTLLVVNFESSAHFSKIELDMDGDTLVVNVQKRFVFMVRPSVVNSAVTNWKIHLKPNTGYVRFRNTLTPLPELKAYPTGVVVFPPVPVIEVFPHKYPYVCR